MFENEWRRHVEAKGTVSSPVAIRKQTGDKRWRATAALTVTNPSRRRAADISRAPDSDL